ncbi:MAG TPA: NAD(P)-binding domain-containing protein [Candidatus Binataceae bacterium]|nr:NAD(P)-binding domain-containing protein [Candidatus Binataceae bacterium]
MMRRLGWIIGVAAILFTALMLAPRTSYQPGRVIAAHAQLEGECGSCHRAWHGPVSQRCIVCHGDISDVNPHGAMDMSDELTSVPPGRQLMLDKNNYLACLSCHSEHQGRIVDISAAASFACTWCHHHPSIRAVDEHVAASVTRPDPPANNFTEPFNHKLHKALIESHYPARPGGFACTSCHIVNAVTPPQKDSMSFRWSSCTGAGCHIAPQDSFLKLPASVGTDPVILPYSARVFHINAVFVHSPGHLASQCITCHATIPASIAPDDDASLSVAQCFTCHAHQSPPPAANRSTQALFNSSSFRGAIQSAVLTSAALVDDHAFVGWLAVGNALATDISSAPGDDRVVACGDCHPFHHHGVVLANDFHVPAPKFPPNQPRNLHLTLYWPSLSSNSRLHFSPVRMSPWWLGTIGVFAASLGFLVLPMLVPSKVAAGEVMIEVAPQPAHEVPLIDDTYQTSVRRLYLIGEAAGTASINLAMRSGRQVIEAIAAELKQLRLPVQPDVYDVAIVGCGPAGLGATATAQVMGLKYVTLEKMTPASTLRAYPRAKFVQATPIDIEEYGTFFLEGDNSREELIREWERIIAQLKLTINDRQEVADIAREPDLFRLVTARRDVFKARCVVLAIGVRGNPRHLNIPGDEPGRVHYMLIDADEYHGREILVVGGGNAGAEVAQALADPRLGNRVTYSFRSPVLTNVSRENVEKIVELQRAHRITMYPATALTAIRPDKVVLSPVQLASGARATGPLLSTPIELANELIFALIGAELPAGFLKKIGVRMGSKGRSALISP